MNGRKWRILLADDNALFRGSTDLLLREDGYRVIPAATADAAREQLRTGRVDLAVLDLKLVRSDPHDVSGLLIALEEAPEVPKILITGHKEMEIGRYFKVLNDRKVPEHLRPVVMFKPEKEGEDEKLIELRTAIHERLVPRVFVVHGHEAAVRDQVCAKVSELGLTPVVLKHKPGVGISVFDKFRLEADRMHFAVVILTGDDMGSTTEKLQPILASRDKYAVARIRETLKPRARQNVIFELGYFAALLGPSRVLVLHEDGVERPSDYEMLHVPLDSKGEWLKQLTEELRHAGVERKPYRSR
ncbi:TIR domain-containing protein [Longimicrobium sp.]|uniref:TIR domain-containing protein n=1 Tax=Longimicrobium sp. TaxID=2029185 RepID=UPI002E301F44|nr:TIR domain-containing protein [Longimicrobium sp.]HEX6036880.1 TIR domain-containing protein [Longimicrobium sp.]